MTHSAKTMALMALRSGKLSKRGRARIERHVADCAVCRKALASMDAYDALVKDVREAPAPELDFSRMEMALRREAVVQAKRNRPSVLPWVIAGLAAAAALAYVGLRSHLGPETPVARDQTEQANPDDPIVEPRDLVEGEVTAIAKGATLELGTGERTPLDIGARLHEGERIVTEASGQVHVRLEDGRGLAVLESSDVLLRGLRAGRVEAELAHGGVANQVRHLDEGDSYRILAGGWSVQVRGTRFEVRNEDDIVSVRVDEGVVEVARGNERHLVRAPGAWASSGPLPEGNVLRPRGLDAESLALPILRLPVVDPVAAWEVDGYRFGAAGGVAMRVPSGDLAVSALDAQGGIFRVINVHIGPEGLDLGPSDVRPRAPRNREGDISPEAISAVVSAGQRRLQRCQEVASRSGPDVIGRFTLRISIDRTGEVSSAQLRPTEGEMPVAEFVQCVEENARRWAFPPPTGGTVTVDVPLRFGTRSFGARPEPQ